jgi:hypothetical protein
VERVVVVVFGVLLFCCVTVVTLRGVVSVVLDVLQKHDVSDRAMIKLQIPIREVVFMAQHYSPKISLARWGNA